MEGDRNGSSEGSSSSRSRNSVMESLSMEINKYPRDLLQRFTGTQQQRVNSTSGREKDEEEEEEEEVEGIELNLGLSLGGRLGVDKTAKKLTRSSSIIGTVPLARDHDSAEFITRTSTPSSPYRVLMRSSSLPSETQEEWRKRKQMQSLRRKEAKRRLSEKQKSSSGSNFVEEERGQLGGVLGAVGFSRCSNLQQQPCSQMSLESHGGSSSVISELESKPFQGQTGGVDLPFQGRSDQESIGSSGKRSGEHLYRLSSMEIENLPNKLGTAVNRGKEKEVGANMPCVFTKGEGPNGRRVDGILYKYGKGEEVRIMCVCHGSFLSPAEFVKHAGGCDVEHPLRHIVINPSGVSSLS